MKSNILDFPIQSPYQRKVSGNLQALASGLIFRCYIQPDRSLVAVLGEGNEHSNQDAIITWIVKHFDDEAISTMSSPLDELTRALYRFLNDKLDCQEYVSC